MGDFLLSVSFIDSIDRGLPVAVVALSKLKAAFNFDSFRAPEERNEEVEEATL